MSQGCKFSCDTTTYDILHSLCDYFRTGLTRYMFIDINPTGTKKKCVDISNMEQVTAATSIQQSDATPLLELSASSVY